MSKLKILVCDDRTDDGVCDMIAEAQPDAELKSLQGKQLEGALVEFFQIVDKFLKSDGRDEINLPESAFDGYDLILVDNNLAELEIPGARLTAEAILGALRAFGTSPYLVSLNKNSLVDFDLRYLIGDYTTRADLALNEEHLKSAALWGGELKIGTFAPWYWPVLPDAARRRRQQIDFVEAHLDEQVLRALAIPAEVAVQLPAHSVGFLDPTANAGDGLPGRSLETVTFWDHFRSSNRSLPLDDRVLVALGGSRHLKEHRETFLNSEKAFDGRVVRRIAARVVAAELDQWIRRDLLGPQDLLVDTPHLQALIGVRGSDEGDDAWQKTTNLIDAPYGFDPQLYRDVLAPHQFALQIWTPRPSFWWPSIEEDPKLTEFRNAGRRDTTLAFAEDTRRFVRTTEAPPPWRFVPDTGKPWTPLFVEQLAGQKYSPGSCFAR